MLSLCTFQNGRSGYDIGQWFSDINNSSRGEYYSKFKTEFKLENYLFRLNAVHRNYIYKLRNSNIKFTIEMGRWVGRDSWG